MDSGLFSNAIMSLMQRGVGTSPCRWLTFLTTTISSKYCLAFLHQEQVWCLPALRLAILPLQTVSCTHRQQAPRKRVQIQNCQTWLRSGIEALVREEIMDKSALQTIDSAPKN